MPTDKERLDWLESQNACDINRGGTTEPYWNIYGETPGHCAVESTLREAIDAGMRATSAEKSKRPRKTPAELDAAYLEAAADPEYTEEMRQLSDDFDGCVGDGLDES